VSWGCAGVSRDVLGLLREQGNLVIAERAVVWAGIIVEPQSVAVVERNVVVSSIILGSHCGLIVVVRIEKLDPDDGWRRCQYRVRSCYLVGDETVQSLNSNFNGQYGAYEAEKCCIQLDIVR